MIAPGNLTVVGFDDSEDSHRAAEWAATDALDSGARLELLAVFDWTAEAAEIFGPYVADAYRHSALSTLESKVGDEAARLRLAHPTLVITTSVRTGSPARILVESSATATMLVVGTRGASRIAELLVGSVSHTVAANATCPAIVINGRGDRAGGSAPVVVGVDGSASSLSALVFASEYASRHGLRVEAIRTCRFDAMTRAALGDDWNDIDPQITTAEYKMLRDDIARTGIGDDPIVLETVTYKHPVRALLDAASHAALLVVGTRGHGPLRSIVLGSVSQSLVQASSCPVAVVAANRNWDTSSPAIDTLAGVTS